MEFRVVISMALLCVFIQAMPGMNGRGNAGNMRGASNANRRPGTGPRKLPPGLQKPSKSRRPHGPPPRGPKRGRTDEEYAECEQIFDKIQEKQAKKRGKPYKKFVWTDGLFESDIVIRAEQCRRIGKDYGVDVPPTSAHARTKRKLTADVSARWDPSRPIYFYIMQTNYGPFELATIRAAVGHWQDETCLNFFELDALPDQNADIDFIFIFKGPDCSAEVGRAAGQNTISLGDGCVRFGAVAHELAHILGFWHEQSRPDRDQYVRILFENVQEGSDLNFAITHQDIDSLGIPYDLSSDLHYGATFFAKDVGLRTVETNNPRKQQVIGDESGLSFYDVKLANAAYCHSTCGPLPCERDGYPNPRRCDRCKCPDGFTGRWCERIQSGVEASCGGVVLDVSCGDTGTINSPSFPDFTGPRTQCSWLIKAPPGGRVAANVTSLVTHTPDLHDACRDYVELKYENNLALAGARYCGSQSLPPREVITSEKEELMVLLRMHTVSSLGKFSLTYSVSCPSVGGTTMPMETTPAPTTPLTTPLITTSSISPTDAQGYSEWTAWSSCCGRCGLEYRGRDCVEPALGCTQTITEERQCTNTRPCSAGFFGRPSCLVLRRSQSCRVDPSGRGCIRSSPHCRRYCCKDFYLDLDDKCIGLPTQQQPAQRTRGNSSKPY